MGDDRQPALKMSGQQHYASNDAALPVLEPGIAGLLRGAKTTSLDQLASLLSMQCIAYYSVATAMMQQCV